MYLSTDIDLSQTSTAVIPLPPQGADTTTGKVTVSGWGVTTDGGSWLPSILQWVEISVVPRATCQVPYGSLIQSTMICAGEMGTGGKDSCNGDSGGPAVQSGVQVGIVSFGVVCGSPTYPGVYTRVGSYINWIKSKGVPI